MTEKELHEKSKKFGAAGYVVPGSSGKTKMFPKRPATALPKVKPPKPEAVRGLLRKLTPLPAPGLPGGRDPAQVGTGNQNPFRPGAAGDQKTKLGNAAKAMSAPLKKKLKPRL